MILQIQTPRWALPLLDNSKRYIGIKGGRASGKSHERAEALVERMFLEPDLRWVCIREIQKSLKFSSKQIIEDKIKKFGIAHLFEITINEIRRIDGDGIIIFQGMQDHTADSIKSLEGFDGAWVEEAQSLSKRSIDLLLPTIRKEKSQIWFTWNPEDKDDAVNTVFTDYADDCILLHVNYMDNPWLPSAMKSLAEALKSKDYDAYSHIWLGQPKQNSDAQIFKGYWSTIDFDVDDTFEDPLQGADFGFNDPTTAVRVYVKDNCLFVTNEYYKRNLDLNLMPDAFRTIPDFDKYVTRADNSRPDTIRYLNNNQLKKVVPCVKGKGSIEDGIEFIKSFDHVYIHSTCINTVDEFTNYKYRINRLDDTVTNIIIDDYNHIIDAIRYALEPLMKNSKVTRGILGKGRLRR